MQPVLAEPQVDSLYVGVRPVDARLQRGRALLLGAVELLRPSERRTRPTDRSRGRGGWRRARRVGGVVQLAGHWALSLGAATPGLSRRPVLTECSSLAQARKLCRNPNIHYSYSHKQQQHC